MLGAALTALVAIAAYKTRTLTRSGAAAGFIAGTITIAAGWSWGFLLLALFVSASILSKLGERNKMALLGPVVEKDGERDAWQVAANGSVFVAAAAAHMLLGGDHWYAIAIGTLAASTADTWSTEIGTSRGRVPRLIISGSKVPPGTSGGLTLAGTLGAFAGAIFGAVGARIAEWPVPSAAVIAGGLAGALGDSLLGATIQSKRWCEQCESSTEREIHSCGTPTTHSGGLKWLNNDGVNFISTIIGGLVALAVA
jgi:uncharacterized protein (TIGR00297 family)